MEEKNEKDDVEKISTDDLIKKLELFDKELDAINAKTDDSDKNKLEYSNIINQYSQNPINSNEIQNQLKISSNLENEEINLSNSTSINSQMENPSLNQYHPIKNLSYNPLSNNVPIPQKDIQSLPNKMIPKNIIYQKTNFSLSQSIIFPNGITKAYIISSFNDQQQTIFLQRFLMGASKEDIETIVKELLGTFRYIIKDKNGNYFCTDLFKVCEQNQRIIILEELSPFLSEDCLDNYATHPIQALIDRASTELEYKLIIYSFNDYNKLHHAFLEPNGAYTILKIIERIPDRYRTEFNFIFTSFVSIISKKKIDNSQNSPIYIFPNGISKSYILASFNDKQQTMRLQRFLMGASKEDIETIVKELLGTFRYIMKDKNGNYFCTDLFKTCDQKHRIMILKELCPFISEDCIDNFATYPIQTLIEKASSEIEYKYILDSFIDDNKLLDASLDHNGAYVFEKIFESIPNRYRTDLNIKIISFIVFISKTRFGIVTVKKFISLSMTSTVVSKLMELVRNNFMYLAEGEYSNYLIQHLLEQWNNTPEGNEIKKLIINNFKEMKQNKYSSYICEMFVENMTPEEKMELIQSLYH